MLDTDETPTIRTFLQTINIPWAINLAKFKHDMILWFSLSRQAFLVVEDPKFHDMIAALSIDAAELLPKSANTIREWVVKEFHIQRNFLIERLSIARSRIHLSFDLWTSPADDRSYIGVVGHWTFPTCYYTYRASIH